MLNQNEKKHISVKLLSQAWDELTGVETFSLEEIDKKIKKLSVLLEIGQGFDLGKKWNSKMKEYLMYLIKRKRTIYEEYTNMPDITKRKLQMLVS